ncbi:MAG: hypothetical protein KC506_01310 [Nanoarchaeota archaeon]|nr:hypothetical protein [Nanoarchaeota archaeon]
MGGKLTVNSVNLDKKRLKTLRSVVDEKYDSIDEFGVAVAKTGEILNHPSYWMYKRGVHRYLNGVPLFPRPARAMFGALDEDDRVSFLEEIGSQVLASEVRPTGKRKVSISYREFSRSRK